MMSTRQPIKALIGSIENIPFLRLHTLLTKEDGVVVARCLDFSVSSHGENEEDALDSLSDSIMDYLDYAVEQGAIDNIIDPEEDSLWEIFRKLELEDESLKFKEEAQAFKFKGIKKVIYA